MKVFPATYQQREGTICFFTISSLEAASPLTFSFDLPLKRPDKTCRRANSTRSSRTMTNRTSPACFVTWSVAIARALAQRTTPPDRGRYFRAMLMTLISDGARSMIFEPENSALARSQGPEEPVLDSCKFQGFVAKFSRYLPLSAPPPPRLSPSCSPLFTTGSPRQAFPRRILAPAKRSYRPDSPRITLAGERPAPQRHGPTSVFCGQVPCCALRAGISLRLPTRHELSRRHPIACTGENPHAFAPTFRPPPNLTRFS